MATARLRSVLNRLGAHPELVATVVVLLWLSVATAYCYFHGYVGGEGESDLAFSVGWSLRLWGIWLILAPLLIRRWRAPDTSLRGRLAIALSALLVALIAMLIFGQLFGTPRPLAQRVYFNLPQAGALLGLLVLVEMARAHWHRRDAAAPLPGHFEIDTGDATAVVADEDIRWVGACGNYVELSDGVRVGRLRSTLSEFESRLPPRRFHRIHRSFLINLAFVDGIEQVPGSRRSRVRLRGDTRTIPASRQGLATLRDRLSG